MPQISLDSTRTVRQWGTALGELDGCTIEEVDDETLAAILAALPDHGGGVTLSEDHATITPNPEPPHVQERRDAAEQRAAAREAAIATLKAHLPEEAHAALLTLIGQ